MNTLRTVHPTRFGQALIGLLAFGVAAYALVGYGALPLGALVDGEMRANFLAHRAGILTHVFASVIALALGPLQFWGRLRRAVPRLHRWLGRLYLGLGVLVGGVAGLYMAAFASGGLAARAGFALLALCWLYTGLRAYQSIRRGAVELHRQWMLRNFALTLAAVSLRLWLPAALVAGVPFERAYPVVAWLCWVPHLAAAQWLVIRRRRAGGAVPPAGPPAHAAPSPAAPRAVA